MIFSHINAIMFSCKSACRLVGQSVGRSVCQFITLCRVSTFYVTAPGQNHNLFCATTPVHPFAVARLLIKGLVFDYFDCYSRFLMTILRCGIEILSSFTRLLWFVFLPLSVKLKKMFCAKSTVRWEQRWPRLEDRF